MRCALLLVTSAFALSSACSAHHRSGAWGDTEAENEPVRASASAPAASRSAAPSAPEICEAPRFLDVKLGTGRVLPATKNVWSVRLIQALSSANKHLSDEDFARMLETAAPLDSCDPSIPEWQYAPDRIAQVELDDGTKLRLQSFLGARAELVWPDGTGVLFDYGDAAPWLPKDAQPFLRRDFQRDADCRGAQGRPHHIAYRPAPTADTAATLKVLAMTCSRMAPAKADPPGSGWCCP